MRDPEATQRAVYGCDLIVDCIGLPMKQIGQHVSTARNVAGAIRRTGARGIHLSSHCAHLPIQRIPLSETHPSAARALSPRPEDILRNAGAAIVYLPDFYGPELHVSTLQQAVVEAVTGKRIGQNILSE